MVYRKLWPLVCLLALALTAGCATVEPDQFKALQAQVYQNQKDIQELANRIERARRPQADLQADMASLRQEMAGLRGQVEETQYRLNQIPGAEAMADIERKAGESQGETLKRLERLEAYLGVKGGKMPEKPAPAAKSQIKAPPPAPQPPQSAKGLYDLGHRLYKQKSYQAARDRFEDLMKKYPKSSLAPSAQYWIGETYYAQKKYEESILAYNQLIKNFSKSSKVPSALLKQGMAFMNLGDKRTARIVLNKLVKSYPKSRQAKTAKKLLAKLK